MVNFTWQGGTGSYQDATQWLPAGVPLYGTDTLATIMAGTVTLSNAEANGITLNLTGSIGAGGTLLLNNAAIGPQMTLEATSYVNLEFQSYDTNYGTIVVQTAGGPGSPKLTMFNLGFGQFNQNGTIRVLQGGLEFSGVVDNNGLIELDGGFINYDGGNITGTGTINFLNAGSVMNALGAVGAGQTFVLQKGSLSIYRHDTFQGTIADFSSSAASVNFDDLAFDTATWVDGAGGAHLDLISAGTVVGQVALKDTPDTQYTVTTSYGQSTITPTQAYSDGSIPGVITEGTVTIRNAEPNGQTVFLGGSSQPNLVLDNAAFGPSLQLACSASATLTVQGYDTNYGGIDVGAPPASGGGSLDISIGAGSQLSQEGTITVAGSSPAAPFGSDLLIEGLGTLNNDGLIMIGSNAVASLNTRVTGSGTIAIDGGTVYLTGAPNTGILSTQTIDFLGGRINTPSSTGATIKDWNSNGTIDISGPSGALVDAVQFNPTATTEGDLLVLSKGVQVGAFHLLGNYATADFELAPTGPGTIGITVVPT